MKKNIAIKLGKSQTISTLIQKTLFDHGFTWNFGKPETIKTPDGYILGVHINKLTISGEFSARMNYFVENGFEIIDSTTQLDYLLSIIEDVDFPFTVPPNTSVVSTYYGVKITAFKSGEVTIESDRDCINLSKEVLEHINSTQKTLLSEWEEFETLSRKRIINKKSKK